MRDRILLFLFGGIALLCLVEGTYMVVLNTYRLTGEGMSKGPYYASLRALVSGISVTAKPDRSHPPR